MNALLGVLALVTAINTAPDRDNWCEVGQKVIIPDGREGPVTSVNGGICRVLVYGEKYVTPWAYFLIEPADPKYGR